jgi:hypothetical protein
LSVKDWKKEAYQIHVAFHDFVVTPLETLLAELVLDEKWKKELQKIGQQAHNMLDSVVGWVEQLSDENLKLQGALEEARRSRT